jgi:hypothetical protein
LYGTVLAGLVIVGVKGLDPVGAPGSAINNPDVSKTSVAAVRAAAASREAAIVSGEVAAAVKVALPDATQIPTPQTPPARIATLSVPEPIHPDVNEAVSPIETVDECLASDVCIDQYLWSLYQRASKFDTVKVEEQRSGTVEKNGKLRTVIKKFTKLVKEDFGWKDPKAAEKAGMPLMEYVIGGVDRSFKLKLYHTLRALDNAGLSPGITSAFRDDYRQSLASGLKAATSRSYHGGSFRGGYGHGLAADLVSVRGETDAERWNSNEKLWKWIDMHGKEFGIGRPYLDKDPAHVAPIDGKEYADHRRGTNAKNALEIKKRNLVRDDRSVAKRVGTERSLELGNI